jgi:hypothetical protein
MDNVFIVAVKEATGEKPEISREAVCELETLLPLIPLEPLKEDLKRIYPYGTCYVRGVREQTGDRLATWSAMAAGDLVLGYRDRSIVSATFVFAKTNDPALAVHLWGGAPGGPFGLICFTDKPYLGEVPIIPQMDRYLDREYGDFARLDAGKVGNILSDYGSLETFVHLCLRYDFPFSFRHS